ncbi:MAG: hypothetical protein IPP79_16525 [Chitinophagaceae bacterium]|nr:hypothetical protein [Chitinophagaceae bacterium]
MNQELWNKILAFDFDNPPSEYGFSIRLANENYWTKNFTEQAILEYKKFMYLAATTDSMVSPSEIVDTVWHQHLIFTQLYTEFCDILGKQIQHVPSTHNRSELEKFKQAKERTGLLYKEVFGDPPNSIWGFSDMYESLRLEKASFKLRTFTIIGILATLALSIPLYFALKPIYIRIENPYFLIGYLSLIIISFFGLLQFNRNKLLTIIRQSDPKSFIFNLTPASYLSQIS